MSLNARNGNTFDVDKFSLNNWFADDFLLRWKATRKPLLVTMRNYNCKNLPEQFLSWLLVWQAAGIYKPEGLNWIGPLANSWGRWGPSSALCGRHQERRSGPGLHRSGRQDLRRHRHPRQQRVCHQVRALVIFAWIHVPIDNATLQLEPCCYSFKMPRLE